MPRLDTERQNQLEPERKEYARKQIEKLGYTITVDNATTLEFEFKGSTVRLFAYSGWFTGKSVKDGRGLQKLLDQIKK